MSLRRKEMKIQNIAKIYLLTIAKENPYIYAANNMTFSSFHSAVELAYAALSSPQKRIINNDFFFQDYPGWWKSLYKKNNYLRLKSLAVNRFLEVFYEIEE